MINFQFESFLGNVSFLILLIMMLIHWIQASFSLIPKYKLIGFIGTISANFSLLLLLLLRWIKYGHFPLSNLYESLMFLSWSLTLLQLLLEKTSKNSFLSTILAPLALFTNSFATFSLPKEMQKATVLVPALQSNWLVMHVTIMMLSYAALLCGSLLSIAFLIITYGKNPNPKNTSGNKMSPDNTYSSVLLNTEILYNKTYSQINEYEENRFALINSTSEIEKIKFNKSLYELSQILDNLSYRTLGIGFPLLTIGILSGAVWANEAWGSYWSWDPKETWALITWLVFAIYFHTRITKGWQGKKPAIIATLGFLVVWICYLGVNLLGKGLHSYGWIQ